MSESSDYAIIQAFLQRPGVQHTQALDTLFMQT